MLNVAIFIGALLFRRSIAQRAVAGNPSPVIRGCGRGFVADFMHRPHFREKNFLLWINATSVKTSVVCNLKVMWIGVRIPFKLKLGVEKLAYVEILGMQTRNLEDIMSAVRSHLINPEIQNASVEPDMFCGDGCDLFISGSAPAEEALSVTGDATGAFISGSAPLSGSHHAGDATGLFISGSAPAASASHAGDATDLFISGSAPAKGEMSDGAATGLFISGSNPA
ncbi:hypothetical protein VK792_04855 [Mesobacterium sp. TK19101]|uniref:Uncharacterized protein n=1 Tax=Mesobacterium hydrothermale TaxID=3111907 RepID=A0ABU6HFU8_9RHOB|nr:hypothetical protein [Mesobacterium sp. TK19101]MEC3860604.1 hypothetical protein [Mesobacterium sp. TK19101]